MKRVECLPSVERNLMIWKLHKYLLHSDQQHHVIVESWCYKTPHLWNVHLGLDQNGVPWNPNKLGLRNLSGYTYTYLIFPFIGQKTIFNQKYRFILFHKASNHGIHSCIEQWPRWDLLHREVFVQIQLSARTHTHTHISLVFPPAPNSDLPKWFRNLNQWP